MARVLASLSIRIIRGVVVNFDLGERFPRPRSQQWGSLHPRARRVAVLGWVREGVALSRRRVWGCHPGEFFGIFDAKSPVWGQFGPENKLIEGQPNEYDVICRNASVLAFHLGPVPAPKYLLERRFTAFPHHYTPRIMCIYTISRQLDRCILLHARLSVTLMPLTLCRLVATLHV